MIGRFRRKSWTPASRLLRPDSERNLADLLVMRRSRRLYVLAAALLALSLLLPSGVFGQAAPSAGPAAAPAITRDAQGHPTVRAHRVGEAIVVDGRLGEPFYETASPFDDLIQAVPVSRGVPSERTEVWIGFDDANLYVAARVWDSLGEAGWIANEMRRDSTQLRSNDSFGIYLDTYHDRRNAVGFFVNPIGGYAEVQITNEATPNFDWNPVWDVATGRFDGGWTVEMAIPFKSLRYRPGVEQIWGIQIRRSVLRSNEWSYLTAVPIQVAGSGPNAVFRVSMYGRSGRNRGAFAGVEPRGEAVCDVAHQHRSGRGSPCRE